MVVKRARQTAAERYAPVSAPTTDTRGKLEDAVSTVLAAFPGSVADTEPGPVAPCTYPLDVVICQSPGPGVVCAACCLREIGESWSNLAARTNAGIPFAQFYRKLEADQARPDPEYARAILRARRYQGRG